MMYKRHPRLLKLWQKLHGWSITIDAPKIEVTFWDSDDIHLRERTYKVDKELRMPYWIWRPYCWRYGHEEYYDYCIHCEKVLRHRVRGDGTKAP